MFPFTFASSIPGIRNPFSTTAPPVLTRNSTSTVPSALGPSNPASSCSRPPLDRTRVEVRRNPSPALTRKRGWEPSIEASSSTTSFAEATGYLDTPAKYRDMDHSAMNSHYREDDNSQADEDLPRAAKRRRTVTGSIVSTAVSAALIGTALGLTVYRLWRDRGKEREIEANPTSVVSPPPPYRQYDDTAKVNIIPPTPQRLRKPRHHNTPSTSRRSNTAHRRPRTRQRVPFASPTSTFSQSSFDARHRHHEFSEPEEEEDVVEDQMDWIGGKLSALIEEGKKALGQEIVVASETSEDQVDNGMGVWEEEQEPDFSSSFGTWGRGSTSRRAKKPRSLITSMTYRDPTYASPPISALSRGTRDSSPATSFARGRMESVDSSVITTPVSASASVREEEGAWASPEMKELMERARAKVLSERGRV